MAFTNALHKSFAFSKDNIFLFSVMHIAYNLPYDIDCQYAHWKLKGYRLWYLVKLLFYFLQFRLNLLLIWLNFTFISIKHFRKKSFIYYGRLTGLIVSLCQFRANVSVDVPTNWFCNRDTHTVRIPTNFHGCYYFSWLLYRCFSFVFMYFSIAIRNGKIV